MDVESRARVKHGPMDSPRQCGPPHFSFPQQTSPPTQTSAKQKTAEDQRRMHSRPKIPVISSRKMQRRHRHEFDRLPSPDPRLSLRFMPGDKGFAWRYYLPSELQFRASNNLLEHIAVIITTWVDILAGRLKHGDCALSIDSTTSAGWLRKSNFIEDDESPIQEWPAIMHYTTCKQESENTASGSAVSRTRSQTPSRGTTTARTTNSPTFSAHTAPPRFLLFSRLFRFPTK